MATKDAFTPEEWRTLQLATTDTILYLSAIDLGFWDTFKEAGHAGKFVASQATEAPSLLIRDLAHDARAKSVKGEERPTAANIEGPALEHISAASALIAEKAPEDLAAFKAFVIGLAEQIAEAASGVSDVEESALEKVKAALG